MATIETTEKYWDCECDKSYIKPASMNYCGKCDTYREDQPDSRIREVLATYPKLKRKDLLSEN